MGKKSKLISESITEHLFTIFTALDEERKKLGATCVASIENPCNTYVEKQSVATNLKKIQKLADNLSKTVAKYTDQILSEF